MIDFNKIKTIPIKQRKNKTSIKDFINPKNKKATFYSKELELLAEKIVKARQKNKEVIWMMGAHQIKVGLSPHIIDLLKKRVITHIAMNGATSIHDFEISLIGATSEDVKTNIKDGSFGMAEETGKLMNEAIKKNPQQGYGMAIGKEIAKLKYKKYSILYTAYKFGIPATVHVAIGTDIIHQHPSCDGASLGMATYEDFKKFTNTISKLENGVLLNVGSAVIMPEVFLKSLSIARNLGFKLKNFTTANLDMIDHYRPRVNVIQRSTKPGINIIAKHEQTIPAMHNIITKKIGRVIFS